MELDFSEQIKNLFLSRAEKNCPDCGKPMSQCECDTSNAKKDHPDKEDKKDVKSEKGNPMAENKEEMPKDKSEAGKMCATHGVENCEKCMANMNSPMSALAKPSEDMEEDPSHESKETKDEEDTEDLIDKKAQKKVKAYLEAKVLKHNENHDRQISFAQLQEVFIRGSKTFDNNHRIGVSRNQWAFARVNSFLKLVSDQNVNISYAKADSDILTFNFDSSNFEFSSFSDIEFQLAKISLLESGLSQQESELEIFASKKK
jgi:hypothetical protein